MRNRAQAKKGNKNDLLRDYSSDDEASPDAELNIEENLKKKYKLEMRRQQTLEFDYRNLDLKKLMANNPVIIFPHAEVQAWDHLPRFTFLDIDMKKILNAPIVSKQRHRQLTVSNFVGSPVRTQENGGILTKEREKKRVEGKRAVGAREEEECVCRSHHTFIAERAY